MDTDKPSPFCPNCGQEHGFPVDHPRLIAEFKRLYPSLPLKEMAVICDACTPNATKKLAMSSYTIDLG